MLRALFSNLLFVLDSDKALRVLNRMILIKIGSLIFEHLLEHSLYMNSCCIKKGQF